MAMPLAGDEKPSLKAIFCGARARAGRARHVGEICKDKSAL
jgi:hypothetical protein